MQIIYGNFDPRGQGTDGVLDGAAGWTLRSEDAQAINALDGTDPGQAQAGDAWIVSPLIGMREGTRYYLLTQAGGPEDRQFGPLGAIIGAHTLEYNNGGWKVLNSEKTLEEVGSGGSVSLSQAPQRIDLSPTESGFELHAGYLNQGLDSDSIIIYVPVDDRLRRVFELNNAAGDNGGTGDQNQWAYDTALSFLPNAQYSLYDIDALTTGSGPAVQAVSQGFVFDGPSTDITPVHMHRIFHFAGNKYVEEMTPPVQDMSGIVGSWRSKDDNSELGDEIDFLQTQKGTQYEFRSYYYNPITNVTQPLIWGTWRIVGGQLEIEDAKDAAFTFLYPKILVASTTLVLYNQDGVSSSYSREKN